MGISARSDYLMRMIAEAMQVLRRIAGLRQEGRLDEALEAVDRSVERLLGPLAGLVPRLDAATAAQFVGNPDQILAWAQLVMAEAEIRELQGDFGRAESLRQRALALAREAQARYPADGDAAAALITEWMSQEG